ncbi:MAG TPA: hypothetical protein DCL66_12350, partial [Gammaproteobacteria bacterium]|nr:hypothetical protein [Gammaproteobacteria bacterium]
DPTLVPALDPTLDPALDIETVDTAAPVPSEDEDEDDVLPPRGRVSAELSVYRTEESRNKEKNNLNGHSISWGRWGNPASGNWVVIDSIGENKIRLTTGDYTAELLPSDIADLSGSFVYGTNVASSFIGHGSAGAIDSLIAQMNVEFDTGQISGGVLQIITGDQTWGLEFSGAISQGSVQLNGVNGRLSNSTGILSTDLNSSLGGAFTGEKAEAFIGGFNLIDANNPANNVQGLYTMER